MRVWVSNRSNDYLSLASESVSVRDSLGLYWYWTLQALKEGEEVSGRAKLGNALRVSPEDSKPNIYLLLMRHSLRKCIKQHHYHIKAPTHIVQDELVVVILISDHPPYRYLSHNLKLKHERPLSNPYITY